MIGAPLRMVVFPDDLNERLHLISLRAERLAEVLSILEGRILEIGVGDSMLVYMYREQTSNADWQ